MQAAHLLPHDKPLPVAAGAASCRAPGMESRESASVGHGQ